MPAKPGLTPGGTSNRLLGNAWRLHMALTLTRRKGQAILVGDDILVTVVRASSGGVIRLSIDAPKTTKIARTEILPEAERTAWEDKARAAVDTERRGAK